MPSKRSTPIPSQRDSHLPMIPSKNHLQWYPTSRVAPTAASMHRHLLRITTFKGAHITLHLYAPCSAIYKHINHPPTRYVMNPEPLPPRTMDSMTPTTFTHEKSTSQPPAINYHTRPLAGTTGHSRCIHRIKCMPPFFYTNKSTFSPRTRLYIT